MATEMARTLIGLVLAWLWLAVASGAAIDSSGTGDTNNTPSGTPTAVIGSTSTTIPVVSDFTKIQVDDVPSGVISSGILNRTAVFGYTYESNVNVNSIAWDALTHLVLAFFSVDARGAVTTTSNNIATVVNTAHKNGVKVLASIGGDGTGSSRLTAALSSNTTRATLAASLTSVIKSNGLDGADYDLEFPGSQDELDNLFAGLQAIRATMDSAFVKGTKTLTMTLYSSNGKFGPSLSPVDATPFSDLVDYGLLMSYDYFGGFSETSGPNSPYYDIPGHKGLSFTSSVSAWIRAGWDPKKLVAGLPYYGRSSVVSIGSSSTRTQFMPSAGGAAPAGPVSKIPGAWTWFDLRDPKNGALSSPTAARGGWQRFWDDGTLTPWLLDNSTQTYIGYDDQASLTAKAGYALNSGLGGTMIWMVQYDYNGELSSVVKSYRSACMRIAREAEALEASMLSESESESDESDSSDSSDEPSSHSHHSAAPARSSAGLGWALVAAVVAASGFRL
ncbi:hypothetical protein H4R18_000601 [Coemansia javaensis]|uniref:GH18 domain-containing protein n=1 Tax=Coemansia javaensis TaxID=2761396 RepID=A0A9W8LLF5_9FUNG|nr:hypothetical protein H4R18_000601 [Coemansia javaensis]